MAEVEALELAIVEELESVQRKSHRSKLAQELRLRNMLQGARERAKRIQTLQAEHFTGSSSQANQNQGGLAEFMPKKQHLDQTLKEDDDDNAGDNLALLVGEEDPQQVAKICALGGEMTFADEEEERAMNRPRNRLERRLARARVDEFVLSHEPFTGEEHLGRYLDLHEFHLKFQNLAPAFRNVSYLEFLRVRLVELPPPVQPTNPLAYSEYLMGLKTYLVEFERRATPLVVVSEGFEGEDPSEDSSATSKDKPFEAELKRANNAGDLERALSLQQLKDALAARGLKASGTAQQRAARLFAVKNLSPDQYPLELLSTTTTSSSSSSSLHTSDVSIKSLEAFLLRILQRLKPFVQATQQMVTKKLTMTYEEISQELKEEEKEQEAVEKSDEEDAGAGEEDDEDFKQTGIVDPTTGRIIPKWMYRLHGLNQEFKCEICGGHSYFGRRAYDRHFKDFRHANGMRALGIPNTLHFHDITKIDDAKRLYASLKKELEKTGFDRHAEEQFEDSQGNILTKSAYEDLKREGLL